MNTITLLLALGLASAAQAAPFADGDAAHGRALYDKDCAGCHAQRFGGDGSAIFTRPDHKVLNASSLVHRIASCNANLRTNLSAKEQTDIGAFLNQSYYHYK